ncbi:DUF4132 domain-containing protein [Glycomyces arizonensis]|uniref:DUF4132 domain-containing protein n=1 Tax=Glycomyces arizonensis TaxID=256035 RepID=UPI000417A500|nr:DUF4132 domain-containing protein [Glycomyces arizonensis]
MTETPTPSLPDEHRLDLPADWSRYLPLRRGQGRRGIEADLARAERTRSRLSADLEEIVRILELEPNEGCRDEGLAFADGEPHPFGAAVVGVIAQHMRAAHRVTPFDFFNLVLADHGPAVAVAAAVEFLGMVPSSRHASEGQVVVHWANLNGLEHAWKPLRSLIGAVRDLVAAVPDAEYASITALVDLSRGTAVKRLAAAVLVPEETAWVKEACAEYTHGYQRNFVTLLLLQAASAAGHAEGALALFAQAYRRSADWTAPLVAAAGTDALPHLTDALGYRGNASERKALLAAIAVLPDDEAMAHLLDHLGEPQVITFATEAAARFPRRALRLAAARAADAASEERRRLAAILRSDPVLLETALPTLDRETRDAVAAVVETGGRLPGASEAELPALLANPPWARKGGKRKGPVVDGLVPPPVNRVELDESERVDFEWRRSGRDQAHFDAMDRHFGRDGFDYTEFFVFASVELARARLGDWHGETESTWSGELKEILHRLGPEATDPVLKAIAAEPAYRGEAILGIVSLGAARTAADWLVRRKSSRRLAARWLELHSADAALLLIPDALGAKRKERTAAEAALRHLTVTSGPGAVREAAEAHGPEAAAAIEELTGRDPLDPVGKRLPKTAEQFAPALFPQVLLKGRERALPESAVAHLVTVLSIATPDYPYAGIGVVAEHCDRESLARFSWAVFEHWLNLGAPPKHGWALTQLAHFADDDTVRDLTAHLRRWPGMNHHRRALTGLEVLGAIGSEAALRAVHSIAEKSEFEALRMEADTQIRAVADGLGLSCDQLADRLVPDFGLGEAQTLLIDYGPRRFTVGFDEQLKPFVTDDKGKQRKALPKPGVKDDEELAQRGRKRFTQLKKELRTVSAEQVKRMERAMVEGRTWSAEEFRRHVAEHALVWHLAHRLVWLADAGGKRTAFRLAEDRSCADVEEDDVALPGDAVIRLAHPVLLGEQVGRWSELFADYELLQPFAQLARPAMAFTPEEDATGRLERFEGREVSTGALMGLAAKGWDRSESWRGGWEAGMSYVLPEAGVLAIGLGAGTRDTTQTITSVRLHRSEGSDASLLDADPVLASEVLAGLAKVTKTL